MYIKYKKIINELELAVKESFSWAEVCRKIKSNERTGNQSHVKKVCIAFGFDFSHFTGQSWRRNKCFKKTDINDYLSNKKRITSHQLKIRLITEKIKEEKCESCGLSEWMNEPLVLELDHIDSNHLNNNLENIQIICPNCHAIFTRNRNGYRKGYTNVITEKIIKIKEPKIDGRTLRKIRIDQRKIKNRPSIEELICQVKEFGFSQIGRQYGVSDNCIRKWIKGEGAGMVDNSFLEKEVK